MRRALSLNLGQGIVHALLERLGTLSVVPPIFKIIKGYCAFRERLPW